MQDGLKLKNFLKELRFEETCERNLVNTGLRKLLGVSWLTVDFFQAEKKRSSARARSYIDSIYTVRLKRQYISFSTSLKTYQCYALAARLT